MSQPLTISAERRDLLYHRLMIHLSGIEFDGATPAADGAG